MSTTPKERIHKGGPPVKNANALRHGLHSGKLPKNCRYIENRILKIRRQLESAVIAARGEVTLTDAANINTAIRWERHAALAQRWLTKKCDELKPEQLLHFSREIGRASTDRDKAIAALKLDTTKTVDLASYLDEQTQNQT